MVIKLFRMPSSEKMFTLVVASLVMMLSSFNINCEKLMLQSNMLSPSSRIASEMREFMFKICSIKKYQELDRIAKMNNLNRN